MEGAANFRVAADTYDRFMGRYSPGVASALLAAVGVPGGARALDVGCGPGALTAALAAAVGAENVAAVDPSPPFVEACRGRVPGADVRLAGAEELPFDDGSFDVVLSQLVVNFMTDAAAGVREMRRVARAGGTVTSAVWDYSGGMTLLRSFWDAAHRVDEDGAAGRDEARVMRYCNPEDLAALWREAGLRDVAIETLDVSADYEDFDALWEPLEHGVAPAGAYVVSLDPQRRAALRAELHRSLGAPAGPFTLSARAWCAIGRA